jgi:two-component system sensor histidine kinase TctE
MAPLDLSAIAFEAVTSWVPNALKKNIDLGFEGTQAPLPVLGEPSRLRELLDNLIDNALRYSREGGCVTLSVSAVPAPSFAVTDDAPRIPDEEKERIFERFYRPLGNASEGSGLGLAIARNIAQIHGARVRVHPGRDRGGNIFEVTFPPVSRSD